MRILIILQILTIGFIYGTPLPDIKLLILIAASDEFPIYQEVYKIWRAYMHSDPTHIEAYFIKADPDLPVEYEIQGDTIWCKTIGSLSPGVLNKTILSLESLLPKLNNFDYVLRTTSTSFYVFPRLLNFLDALPRTGCYCAVRYGFPIASHSVCIGSGAGLILSKDLAISLLDHKKTLINCTHFVDDVAIGLFLFKHGIPLIGAPRMEFPSIDFWFTYEHLIPHTEFHFRCKNDNLNLRETDELYIMQELLNSFYQIDLRPPECVNKYETIRTITHTDFNEYMQNNFGMNE